MFQKLIRRTVPPPSSAPPPRISSEACAAGQGDALALFHSGTGIMFKANAMGARIWAALAQQTSMDRLAEELAQQYGIPKSQAESDIAGFLAELKAAGLLDRAGE